MVKRISRILIVVLMLFVCITLTGCKDQEKQDFAEKVVDRYNRYTSGEANTPFLYDDLLERANKKFGESNYGSVAGADVKGATGVLFWIDGDYTAEEIQARVDGGKKLTGLVITFAAGLAVDAYYGNLSKWL